MRRARENHRKQPNLLAIYHETHTKRSLKGLAKGRVYEAFCSYFFLELLIHFLAFERKCRTASEVQGSRPDSELEAEVIGSKSKLKMQVLSSKSTKHQRKRSVFDGFRCSSQHLGSSFSSIRSLGARGQCLRDPWFVLDLILMLLYVLDTWLVILLVYAARIEMNSGACRGAHPTGRLFHDCSYMDKRGIV